MTIDQWAFDVMIHVQLPENENITLFEAVTAFVSGRSCDPSAGPFYPTHVSDTLLERLHEAARAGSVRFCALDHLGNTKYHEIDPAYFKQRLSFDWQKNQILCWAQCGNGEYDEELCLEWIDVHLSRENFVSLLNDMGVSVQQGTGPDVGSHKVLKTGVAGRPSSKHLVMEMAQRRHEAGDLPGTLKEFSHQLEKQLKAEEPKAPPMTAKTIENTVRPSWRAWKAPK